MVLAHIVVFMLTVFVAVMGVKNKKKNILNQIILKPTIIFNKYLVYIKKFSCNLLLLKETYFC